MVVLSEEIYLILNADELKKAFGEQYTQESEGFEPPHVSVSLCIKLSNFWNPRGVVAI